MPAPLRLKGFEFEAGFEPKAAVFVDRGAVLTVPAGMVPAGAVAAAVVPTTGMEPTAEVWVPDEIHGLLVHRDLPRGRKP